MSHIDSYNQMLVELDVRQIETLVRKGVVKNEIWRSSRERPQWRCDLVVRVRDVPDGLEVATFPRRAPMEDRTRYEVSISPEALENLRNGKSVGGSMPRPDYLRYVSVRHDEYTKPVRKIAEEIDLHTSAFPTFRSYELREGREEMQKAAQLFVDLLSAMKAPVKFWGGGNGLNYIKFAPLESPYFRKGKNMSSYSNGLRIDKNLMGSMGIGFSDEPQEDDKPHIEADYHNPSQITELLKSGHSLNRPTKMVKPADWREAFGEFFDFSEFI